MPNFGMTSWGANVAQFSACRSMVGTLPATSGMVLDSITVYRQPGPAATVGIYVHGTEATPSGATLLETLTLPSLQYEGAVTVNSVLHPALPSGAVLRFAIMGDGTDLKIYATLDPAQKGDWAGPRYESAVVTPATGYPTTWPADSGSAGTTYLSMSVTYSTGGGPTNTPPTVSITSPTAETVTVPSGTRLQVSATASDQQSSGQQSTDISNSISWSSSNPADVPAGGWPAGGTLIIDTAGWANGTRTIAANVTDAGGLQAAPDSFTLTIGPGGGGVSPAARFILSALGGY